MKSLKIKKPRLIIFGDENKPQVEKAIANFGRFAKTKAEIIRIKQIQKCQSGGVVDKSDFAVVFGGDGSILAVARGLAGKNVPIIGVNLGKLGFLAEFSIDELKEDFENIMAKVEPAEERIMLKCSVTKNGKEKFSSTAINDVFITAGQPFRTIELKIKLDAQPLTDCVSDGIIISTPTGSTAYNLSAGGPILEGKIKAMTVTPICPHSLSFRPIVISDSCKVEIMPVSVNEGTTLSIDGQISYKLKIGDVVKIEKEKHSFLIVNSPKRSQWDTLSTKLKWAEKPRYNIENPKS